MAQISIIVPIYQVEKYIEQCIQSILGQTLQNIEIFLINDGSPDGCGVICEKYAAQDERIHYIRTPNCGVGTARNMGIEAAGGEWLCFVDGDDYLPENALGTLLTTVITVLRRRRMCGFPWHGFTDGGCLANELRCA